MARIAGVDLPRNKRIEVALTYIYGIGRSQSKKICAQLGIAPAMRTEELTDDHVAKMRGLFENEIKVEGDLRRDVNLSIKRLMDMGCYRGLRHRKGFTCSWTKHSSECSNSKRTEENCSE